jgi:hypothetical protein
MQAIELAALLWASAWAWHAGSRLFHGDRNSLMILYLVFYAEYAAPLAMDAFMGRPVYANEPGFFIASQDPYVRALYCAFLVLVPPIWLWNAEVRSRTLRTPSPQWVIMALRLGSLLPVFCVWIAPQPSLYLQYAGVLRANAALDVIVFHIVVSMATMVAVLCAAGRCLTEHLNKRTIAEIAIAAALSIWINGKRYIVAETLMLVLLALWYRGAITGKKLACAVLAGALVLAAFSATYQSNMRGISYDPVSRVQAAADARNDYTRDSRVQMAIYSALYPDKMQILDYPGQNLLYYATLLVPRSMWSKKPYPYAYYFTSAMLNRYPQDLGWGMTTGIFDETIANVGLAGILLGPLWIRWFCSLGDSAGGWGVHILTCVVGCLLLSVQLAAFTPLLLIWIVIVAKNKRIPFWRPSAGRPRSSEVSE